MIDWQEIIDSEEKRLKQVHEWLASNEKYGVTIPPEIHTMLARGIYQTEEQIKDFCKKRLRDSGVEK